jgi:hypothetical protein
MIRVIMQENYDYRGGKMSKKKKSVEEFIEEHGDDIDATFDAVINSVKEDVIDPVEEDVISPVIQPAEDEVFLEVGTSRVKILVNVNNYKKGDIVIVHDDNEMVHGLVKQGMAEVL